MNKDRLNELLRQCGANNMEKDLVKKLYPCLKPDWALDLRAQYVIDFLPKVTVADFAFPDAKIAIYCDGFGPRQGNKDAFKRDRLQSRELQLRGWIVLRFAGSEIWNQRDLEMVVKTIQGAIELRKEQQAELEKQQQKSIELEEELNQQKEESKVWQYVAAVLGVCLLISTVFLWRQFSKPELPAVYGIDEGVVIPAGEFQMGGSDSDAEIDEHPVHTVDVNAFYIHKYEVTNAQYKNFVDANPQWQKNSIPRKFHNGEYLKLWKDNTYPPGKENHPVVYVNWYAAMAYAKWAGRRLPTEAEWEKAARGGLVGTKYPWGDVIDDSMANYGGEFGDTKPVGSYAPNDYGLYDMTGNVMEWCLDAYDESFYNHSPSRNPIAGGPLVDIVNNFLSVTNPRVVRSGCWYNVPMHVRVADRYGTSPDDASGGRGFRCAVSITGLSE